MTKNKQLLWPDRCEYMYMMYLSELRIYCFLHVFSSNDTCSLAVRFWCILSLFFLCRGVTLWCSEWINHYIGCVIG
jgi:hypothetical protein